MCPSVCRSSPQSTIWSVLENGLQHADEEVAKAIAKRNECSSDIEAADRRLARLRTVAPLVTEPVEVVELQGKIDELIQ